MCCGGSSPSRHPDVTAQRGLPAALPKYLILSPVPVSAALLLSPLQFTPFRRTAKHLSHAVMATAQAAKSSITLKGSADIVTEFFGYGINSILYQRVRWAQPERQDCK